MKTVAVRKGSRRARPHRVPPVGSQVSFVVGAFEVTGTVIEDRGYLGQHMVRIRYEIEGVDEPLETEMPVEDLRGVA